MNDIHKAVLREKNDFLMHEITATHILQKLLRVRVIDKDQAAKVLDAHEQSKMEGMELLLKYLSRGGSKSFDNFLEVLRKENYDEVANELVKAATRKEKLQNSKIPVTPKLHRKTMTDNSNQQSGKSTYRSEEKNPAPNKPTNATKASDARPEKTRAKDKTFIAKSQAAADKPSHGSQHGVRSSINDSKSSATRQPVAAGKTKPVNNNGASQPGSVSLRKTRSGNTTTPVSTKPTNTTNSNSTKTSQPSHTTSNSKTPNATNNKQPNARSSQATSNTNTQSTTSNIRSTNAKQTNPNATSQSKKPQSTSPSKSSNSTSISKQSDSTGASKSSHPTSPSKKSNTSPSKQPNAASNSKPVNDRSSLMISSTKLPTNTKQSSKTTGSEATTSTATNKKSQSSKRDNEPRAVNDPTNAKPSLTASSKPLNSKTAGTGNSKPANNQQHPKQEKTATGRTPKPVGVQPKTKPNKRFIN